MDNVKRFITPAMWKVTKNVVIIMFCVFIIAIVIDIYTEKENIINKISDKVVSRLNENSDYSKYNSSTSSDNEESTDCNVRRIRMEGSLVTYVPSDAFDNNGNLIYDMTSSNYVTQQIKKAKNEEKIKAILIDIDSSGGDPVAGYEIAKSLKEFNKISVSLIRQTGASASYLASTGANYIIASKYSDVGSIGVNSSFVDNSKKNQKEGYVYNKIIAGQYKDIGSPDKPLTIEEKNLLQKDVNTVYENFIKDVAENRKLSIDEVKKLADGNTMLGEKALQNKLIDQLGSETEALNYIKDKIGEEVIVCD